MLLQEAAEPEYFLVRDGEPVLEFCHCDVPGGPFLRADRYGSPQAVGLGAAVAARLRFENRAFQAHPATSRGKPPPIACCAIEGYRCSRDFRSRPRKDTVTGRTRCLGGRVALVTGAGRGIGAATARALTAAGVRVVVSDVDGQAATATAERIGGQASAVRLDVADRPAFTAALDDIEHTLGPLDILINNAAVLPVSPLADEPDTATTRQLEINLHGVIHGTREAVRRMRPRGTGHIINVSSAAGIVGLPGAATYSATKYGVIGLSEAVRAELRGTGVNISYVVMSFIRTDMTAGFETSRLMKPIPAETVAAAIIHTLRRPRFDVFVPHRLAAMHYTVKRLLPRAVGEPALRLLRADRVVLAALSAPERAAYEQRICPPR